MTSPSEVERELLDVLAPVVNDVFPVVAAAAGFMLVFWAFSQVHKLFKLIIVTDAVPAPKPPATVSENYRRQALEPKPQPVACDCAACRSGWGHTAAALTPPTLEDWEGWKKYGLVK